MPSGDCSPTECAANEGGPHCFNHGDGRDCCFCGKPRPGLPSKNADHRCKCGHIKYAHEKSQYRCGVGRNGTCGCQVFVCDHSRCGWKPREDKTECSGVAGQPKEVHDVWGCSRCNPITHEPPMTPEEEEQAPEDEDKPVGSCLACGQEADFWFDRSVCAEPCGSMHYRCNNCGVAEPPCPNDVTAEPPPQPERRPPYLVGYSVAGHLYEVALPGDAVVQAVDGALVIKHAVGFVAGIVYVAPLATEGQG